MEFEKTKLDGVFVLKPKVYKDNRGFFIENWNLDSFNKQVGSEIKFVQENHSHSRRNVLRGLGYQITKPQGKLIRVINGSIYDVAVDLRRRSPTFGCWIGVELSCANHYQLWIPPGFAHGFVVKSECADVIFKVTDYHSPDFERSILWNDLSLNIDWRLQHEPIISDKDRNGVKFLLAEVFE